MNSRGTFVPIQDHWIGIVKDWLDRCQSFGEALVNVAPALSTHGLYIGATGSGKTNCMLHTFVGDLLNGQSVVVLDARGDLVLAIVELAARAGVDPSKVQIIDLREKVNPVGFNPLAGKGEPYHRAFGLVDAVAKWSDYWGPQLAETFRNATLLLAEAQGSLLQLEGLFYDSKLRRELIARAASQSLRGYWERYDSLSPDKQAALASPVMNKVSALISTEGLRRMFGHPAPLDLGRHLRTPGSVTLISLAIDELHSAGWMTGGMLLNALCREVFSQATVAESQRNPIRLYVDEFEKFSMEEFETILAEGRRFGFSVVLAHQTLAQLSPKIRSIILGNVGVKLVFRTSYQDAEILNRDLAGVKGAFDIPNLPVGEAVLWRRGAYPVQIEVNEPLIRDVGGQSKLAQAFLKQIVALRPAYVEPAESKPEPRVEVCELPAPPKRSSCPPNTKLEDWL